ncbi:MAG TPA: single-stranded DNA-binding protein [Candidatus Angelobacter sp.]|jgi:single-strand DNA-binding protein|nr:single-stranded DNA-binding protein [Candidatus Angelobacter sp.]
MVNKVILIGNLTRDSETVAGSRGAVTRMRLATSTHWRDPDGNRVETTEFHSLVAFQRLGEICAQYCYKGRRIYVEGRLRTREYDGSDGLRRTTTEVVVDTMRLLDRREDGGAEGDAVNATALSDAAPPQDDHAAAHAPDESGLALSGAPGR